MDAQRVQRNVRTIRGSNQHWDEGGNQREAVVMCELENTWLGLAPSLFFLPLGKGTSGNALFGQNKCSNGMSSEGSWEQSRVKQNTEKKK